MAFSRTDSGLVNTDLFWEVPVIWVEGPNDIPFYSPVFERDRCRIKSAGGKPKCQMLAEELLRNGYPYVVVLDGDYEMLDRRRSPHRRVVILQRHSPENYLFEKGPAEQACRAWAKVGEEGDFVGRSFGSLLSRVESHLKHLVVLDIANFRAQTGRSALPKRVQAILESGPSITFSKNGIAAWIARGEKLVSPQQVEEAADLAERYAQLRRFVDLLPGHLAFGILWSFIRGVVTAARRRAGLRRPSLDHDALRVLLSSKVWHPDPTKDHSSLRRRLRRAYRDAKQMVDSRRCIE